MGSILDPTEWVGYLAYFLFFLFGLGFSFAFGSLVDATGLVTCGNPSTTLFRTYYAAIFQPYVTLALLFLLSARLPKRRRLAFVSVAVISYCVTNYSGIADFWDTWVPISSTLALVISSHLQTVILSSALAHATSLVLFTGPGHNIVYVIITFLGVLFDYMPHATLNEKIAIESSACFQWLSNNSIIMIPFGICGSLILSHVLVNIGKEWRHNNNVTNLQDIPGSKGGFYDSELKRSYTKQHGKPHVSRKGDQIPSHV